VKEIEFFLKAMQIAKKYEACCCHRTEEALIGLRQLMLGAE
jgi:hypothetical protein